MASGFKVGSDDFDTLFSARTTAAGADTGFVVSNGAGTQGDIANRYETSTGGDQIAGNTGYKLSNGNDLKTRFRAANFAPIVTVQPVGTTVNEGDDYTLSVTAIGNPSISYQWQKDSGGWTDVSGGGATTDTYTKTNPPPLSLDYRCRLTNTVGTTYTNTVHVTVRTDPYITSNPSNVTAANGTGPHAVQCSAGGDGTLYFEWFQNGSSVAGPRTGNISATSDQHVWNPILFANAGTYYCQVTNSYGGTPANSSNATVTVT